MSAFLLVCNRFLNLIVILCLLTPAVVNYWRGTWRMLDLFVFPDDEVLSASFTFTASFGTLFLIMLVEDYLKEFLNARKAEKAWYRAFFYPLALMSVASWRGLWMLLDHYTTTSLTSACVSHAIGFLIVVFTRTTSTIVSIPGYCSNERHIHLSESILQGKHCLKNTPTTVCAEIAARMLNSFVTVFVIGGAVISYWRGTWLIFVTTIEHPGYNPIISSVSLISLGYGIWSVCYFFAEYLSTIPISPPHSLISWFLEQVFVYILGFGVVASWAGIWNLMGACLLPDHPVASALISHFVGIVVLYLLQASINLIGSPVGCRVHDSEKLEGFDLGNYLEKTWRTEPEKQENTTMKEREEPGKQERTGPEKQENTTMKEREEPGKQERTEPEKQENTTMKEREKPGKQERTEPEKQENAAMKEREEPRKLENCAVDPQL